MASTASSRGKHTLESLSQRLSGPSIRQIPGAPKYVNEAFRTIQVGEYKNKKNQPFDWGKFRDAIGIMNDWEAGISSTSPSPRQSSFSDSDMSLDSTFSSSDMSIDTPSPKLSTMRRYRQEVLRVNDENIQPLKKSAKKRWTDRKPVFNPSIDHPTLFWRRKQQERAKRETIGLDKATKKYDEFVRKIRNKYEEKRAEEIILEWSDASISLI